MGELEDKLNSILGDPQAMSQIMALARSLGGGGGAAEQSPAPPDTPSTEPPAAPGDLPGIGDTGLDPRLLTIFSKILQSARPEDNDKAALLQALRPYVKEKRYAKLDKAIQIARLSRLVRAALDVFRGEDDV